MAITEENIAALSREAHQAGDKKMYAICMVALGEADAEHTRLAGYLDQDDAWNECADIIEQVPWVGRRVLFVAE